MIDTDKLVQGLERLLGRLERMLERLLERLEHVLDQLPPNAEITLPQPLPTAMRWQGRERCFDIVTPQDALRLDDLLCIDRQKQALLDNTRQFLHGLPANNALLCGPRGTGKSSLVKALLNQYRNDGLALIEIAHDALHDLPLICRSLAAVDKRFILFCDDLSFQADDAAYKSLKGFLDGSISGLPPNCALYATSNRRHLIPQYAAENARTQAIDGEIHLHESLEEKLSLAERFGIRLSFQAFNQQQFLLICQRWLSKLGAADADGEASRRAALQWALESGSRSGRSAWQFARDRAGKQRLRAR